MLVSLSVLEITGRATRILVDDVSHVVKGIRQSIKHGLSGPKTSSAIANYFYRNGTRRRDDEYLANGWAVASGPVEGSCKDLIKDHMAPLAKTTMSAGMEPPPALHCRRSSPLPRFRPTPIFRCAFGAKRMASASNEFPGRPQRPEAGSDLERPVKTRSDASRIGEVPVYDNTRPGREGPVVIKKVPGGAVRGRPAAFQDTGSTQSKAPAEGHERCSSPASGLAWETRNSRFSSASTAPALPPSCSDRGS